MSSCWDIINTEWDTDQETVNFGTRQCVVVDAALYDVVTLATIECRNHGSKSEPKVYGSLWEQYTVIAVDSFCHILTENCQVVLKSFSLDSCLSSLGWSSDDLFLFLVTEGGFLSVIYLPGSLLVATIPLPGFSSPNHSIYLHVASDEIMILNSTGQLLRISNLNLGDLASALKSKNGAQAAEIQSKMKREIVECLLKAQVTAATVVADQRGELSLAIGTAHGLFLWDFKRNVITTGAPHSSLLKQIEVTNCNRFILTLNVDGEMVCYDRNFLLPVYQFGSSGQLVLFELDKTTKRTLTIDSSDVENWKIVMRSFLGTDIEYKVQVSDFCVLLSSTSKQSDIVFIEGARDSDGNVTTLRIRKMAEGRPVDRLGRLIARGRFDEGLHFARNFNLDTQQVYTAKAKFLAQHLSKWSNVKPDLINEKYPDFISTLDCITDFGFVIECCLMFAAPTVTLIQETLSYARKRLNLWKAKQEDEADRQEYIRKVCSAQEKLDTFGLIYGPSLINFWYEIDQNNIFHSLIEILNRGEMTSALILWQRHNVEIVQDTSFAEEETMQLLASIPSDLKSEVLLPWLQLVLPSLVQFDSARIPLVVDWIIRKSASFETTERQGWPRNALKFNDTLLNSLKATSNSPNGSLAPLSETIHIFNEMVVLYENYKIPITYNKFNQENVSVTINMLLNWLPSASDVGPFMDNFLLPFMHRRDLDVDESVFNYISNLLHNSVSWWHSGQAQWEQIVTTLISYVKSIEVQAKSILAALCQAPVPWSTTITQLAEKGKKLEHPLAIQIKEEHQIVPLKTVLRHYNIHVYELKDVVLMDCIIRNILKRQTDDCLEHALIVARTTNSISEANVQTTYLSTLIWNDKPDRVVETLKKMPKEEQVACCHKLVIFIEGNLNDYVSRPKSLLNEKRAAACMSSLNLVWDCYVAAGGSVTGNSLARRIPDLQNIHKLMSYGVAVKSSEYCHLKKRQDALKRYCVAHLESKTVDYTRLNRVAHLLSLSESFGLQEQILAAKRMNQDAVMVTCAERLLVCLEDPSMAEACFLAAHCLNGSSRANDTIQLQSKLAAKAATYCSSDSLMDASELCRLVNLRHLIQKRSSEVGASPDVYQSVSSLGVYQDFTTPILNRDIMKHLSSAQMRVLPSIKLTKGTSSIVGISAHISVADAAALLGEFTKECTSVIQVLRGCRQLMPALYMTYAVDSLVQLLFYQLRSVEQVAIYNKNVAKHFDELSSQLLVRVMTANRPEVPDMALATSCLLILGPNEGYKYLVDLVKRSTSDRRRVFYVGFLGRLLFKLSPVGGEEEGFFDSVLLRCQWSMKLAPYGVHVQIPPTDEMMPIMDTLVTLEDVPLELISSFCASFPLNVTSAFIARAQFLIVSTDASNVKKRVPKILEVLTELPPHEVQKTIANVRNKASPYNYELLSCLLGFLLKLSPDAAEVQTMCDLLDFLMCYERRSPPGMMEQQTGFYRLPGSSDWPQKRLPMFYQIDASLAKAIYHEEFHVSNWSIWYNSPSLLPINRDEICMLAVNNTVKLYNKEYLDIAQIESLFQKIKDCLNSISSVQLAAVCAGEITQRLPTSPEHLYAAQLHMEQCQKWKEQGDPAGVAAFMKSYKVYQRVQTEDTLAVYKLLNKRYEALTPYPERLIRSLYEDCTPELFQAINGAAETICDIFELKLSVLKLAMITEWLPPIEQYQQDDYYPQHGMDSNGSSKDSNVELQNQTSLQRIICLLSGSDYETWVSFLRERAMNDDERPAVRVRALTALEAVLCEQQMMEYLEFGPFDLSLKVRVLTFLSRLEFLGLVYREEEFEQADKADLIRALLQSGGSTQRCITLAMDLATDNIVQDADIWSSILEKVVRFNMLETAQRLLKETKETLMLWANPVMAPVWNLILQAPFKQSNSDAERCVSTLEQLWSCPILKDIDLTALVKCVLAHDFPYLAALILPFLDDKHRVDLIQKLGTIGSTVELAKKLQDKCQKYPYLGHIKSLIQIHL